MEELLLTRVGGRGSGRARRPAGRQHGKAERQRWAEHGVGVRRGLAGRTAVGSGRRQRVLRVTVGGPRLEGSSSRPTAR